MSPQLTAQQLEHAIQNIQKRVDAKAMEVEAYKQLANHCPAFYGTLSMMLPVSELDAPMLTPMEQSLKHLREATVNLCTAKMNTALVDLEELQLNLKAKRQMQSQMTSGIVGASMLPPRNSRQ